MQLKINLPLEESPALNKLKHYGKLCINNKKKSQSYNNSSKIKIYRLSNFYRKTKNYHQPINSPMNLAFPKTIIKDRCNQQTLLISLLKI